MPQSELPSSIISQGPKVELDKLIAPSFGEAFWDIIENVYSSFWFKGGRGSTKSSFVAINIILGIMDDPQANALVVRKVGDTLRLSVLETLLWAIDKLEVSHMFEHTKSPAEITYKPTGQKIIMKGLDDPLKLKSIKIKKGYFKYLWFEEASEMSGPEEIRSVEQSAMRGGNVFVEFVTYNPPNDPAAWVNKEAEEDVPGRHVYESTYLDVPPEWLGTKFIADAEALKIRDRVAYDHEYMGLAVGRAEQIIFHGKWEEKEFETPKHLRDRFYLGVDWGFASDPAVMIRCYVEDEILYIDYEAFGHGVELDELDKLFDSVPGSRDWPVKADCSQPAQISYVKRKGFNIGPAEKWSGSIEDGINHLKAFKKIIVHPRCKHIIREFSLYSYKVDKITKDILPIIVDKHNHGIDALRYALDGYILRRGSAALFAKLAGR